MKILGKSIEIAYMLFPSVYEERKRYRTFHFAFLWQRSKLLAIGQNVTDVPNAKALKFARHFNVPHFKNFAYLHAEVDAISKLWGRVYVDSSIKLVVLRINKHGQLQMSKPCKSCQTILDALGIDKVWFSNENGGISI